MENEKDKVQKGEEDREAEAAEALMPEEKIVEGIEKAREEGEDDD